MYMTEREVKEELSRKNIRIADVARKFGCTPTNVHQLFKHKAIKTGMPSLIRKYIADQIGKTVEEVWN